MTQSADTAAFVVRFVYGGTYRVDVDRTHLLVEGHSLLAITRRGTFRFGSCNCENCRQHDPAHIEATPEEFARWLLEDVRPASVRLVVHPDMVLPLSDESPSGALKLAAGFAQFLGDGGVPVILTDCLVDRPMQVGTWVRFRSDYLVGKTECVVAGMLGQVISVPYAICTPGISVMVRTVGLALEYGFPWSLVEPVDPPDDAQIDAARQLAARSVDLFQARNGWHGILAQGIHQSRSLRQMRLLPPLLARETDPKAIRGNLKRMARLLDEFQKSPWSEEAAALAARCRAEGAAGQAPPDLLEALARWCAEREG